MERTPTEKRLDELMRKHGAPSAAFTQLNLDLKALVDNALLRGLHADVSAFLLMQHATAYVSALKITKQISADLADTLARDALDSIVNRAVPLNFSGLLPPGG